MNVYTRKAFAEKIGVSVAALRDWEKKGILKSDRSITGRPIYTDEHLYKYINKPIEKDEA